MIGNKIYNEDVKIQFLTEEYGYERCNKKEKLKCTLAFRKLFDYETKFKKDFCAFNSDELDEALANAIMTVSEPVYRYDLGVLRSYLKWCLGNGLITYEQFVSNRLNIRKTIDDKPMEVKVLNKEKGNVKNDYSFVSEDEYFDWLFTLFDKERFVMQRALGVLLYYNFSYNRIIELKRDDVDTINRKVDGVEIKNEMAMNAIIDAKNAEQILVVRPYGLTWLNLNDSDFLFRSIKPATEYGIYYKFSRMIESYENLAAENLPKDNPYKNVRICGRNIKRLRLYLHIKSYEESNGEEEAKIEMNRVRHFDPDTTATYRDYEIWKERIVNK